MKKENCAKNQIATLQKKIQNVYTEEERSENSVYYFPLLILRWIETDVLQIYLKRVRKKVCFLVGSTVERRYKATYDLVLIVNIIDIKMLYSSKVLKF